MRRALSATLAVLVVASAFAGSALATSHGTITADPAAPGDTATHTVTVEVPEAVEGSWNGLEVDYAGSGADVSDVDQGDVVTVGIDRGGDGDGATVDEDVSDDLSSVDAINNGETLQVGFGGSYDLAAGDEVVIVYEDAVNPSSADSYEVDLEINYQSSGGEATATLTIEDDSSDGSGDDTETATATEDDSSGATATDTESGGDTEMDDGATEADSGGDDGAGDDSSGDDGAGDDGGDGADGGDDADGGDTNEAAPGFGVVVAMLALVGAGLFLARRRG